MFGKSLGESTPKASSQRVAPTIARLPWPFRLCGGGDTSANRRMPPAVFWPGALPRGESEIPVGLFEPASAGLLTLGPSFSWG